MVRRVAEQDLARGRTLLEPRGDVDGVPGDECLALLGNDFPGVDPDAQLDTKRRHSAAQLECRASRTQRVILVNGRDTEHGHHGVTDELLDSRTVPFERGP